MHGVPSCDALSSCRRGTLGFSRLPCLGKVSSTLRVQGTAISVRGHLAGQLVELADGEEGSPGPNSAPNCHAGWEDTQKSSSCVPLSAAICSPSTLHLTAQHPHLPQDTQHHRPCPSPAQGLQAAPTSPQTARSLGQGSDNIFPLPVSLSFSSVTAQNVTAGLGLCLQCLNKRSMSSFSHRYLQFKHHFAACPRGAGLLQQSISEGISRRPGCLKEELWAPERATLSRTFMTHWDLLSLIHKLRSDNRFSSLPSRADLLQAGQAPACLRMQKMNLSMMNQSSCSLRYPQRTANGAIYIYAHIYMCVNIYIHIYMYVGVYREVTSFSEMLASQECSG